MSSLIIFNGHFSINVSFRKTCSSCVFRHFLSRFLSFTKIIAADKWAALNLSCSPLFQCSCGVRCSKIPLLYPLQYFFSSEPIVKALSGNSSAIRSRRWIENKSFLQGVDFCQLLSTFFISTFPNQVFIS